jgi:hypothetical protein
VRRWVARLGTARQLLLALVVALVLAVPTVTVPALASAGMLLACLALVAALGVLVQWLWQSRHSTDWSHDFSPSRPPRGVDSRITRLAADIELAGRDAAAAARLHAAVSGLAVERLRDRRGLSLAANPEAGHTALGPDLSSYLTQPPTTLVRPDRLASLVTTLEEL